MSLVAKIAVCTIAAGATSCGLLVIRQHRIETAYEMSRIHLRLIAHEQQVWALRVKVHERVRQDRVAEFARSLESQLGVALVPIRLDPCEIMPIDCDGADTGLTATGSYDAPDSPTAAVAKLINSP